MDYEFAIKDKAYKVSIDFKDGHYIVDLDGQKYQVDSQSISSNCFSLLIGDQTYSVHLAEEEAKKYISIGGEQFEVQEKKKEAERKVADTGVAEDENEVSAPMPGKILKILVSEGEKVRKNQSLAIVEAMKMEHEIKSPLDGEVKKIHFKEEDLVDTGQPIIELEKPEETKEAAD